MLKTSLIAASLLMMATGGALAQQDMRAQYPDNHYGRYSGWDSPEAFSGINRFCGPGEIPQSFPDGNGVRCELPGGGYRYY
jgi:hypothetical protein